MWYILWVHSSMNYHSSLCFVKCRTYRSCHSETGLHSYLPINADRYDQNPSVSAVALVLQNVPIDLLCNRCEQSQPSYVYSIKAFIMSNYNHGRWWKLKCVSFLVHEWCKRMKIYKFMEGVLLAIVSHKLQSKNRQLNQIQLNKIITSSLTHQLRPIWLLMETLSQMLITGGYSEQ